MIKNQEKITLNWLKKNAEKELQELRKYSEEFKEDMYDSTGQFFSCLHVLREDYNTDKFRRELGKFLDNCFEKGDKDIVNSLIITFFGTLTPEEYFKIKKNISKDLITEVEAYFKTMFEKIPSSTWMIKNGK